MYSGIMIIVYREVVHGSDRETCHESYYLYASRTAYMQQWCIRQGGEFLSV